MTLVKWFFANFFVSLKSVFAVNSVCQHPSKMKCKSIYSSYEHDSPKDFLQSQWQRKEKSVIYLIYRWFFACFFIFSVVNSLLTFRRRGDLKVYWIFISYWNLTFTMIAQSTGAVLVTLYHFDMLNVTDKMTLPLKFYWFLSTSSNMYAFIVSIIYWNTLYKTESNGHDFNNIIVHVTNSLMILINLTIVKQPERIRNFLYPMICGFFYLFFTWFFPFLGGKDKNGNEYVYRILDWKKKPGTAVVVASLVLITGAIIHCLIVGLQRIRAKAYQKFFKKSEIVLMTDLHFLEQKQRMIGENIKIES